MTGKIRNSLNSCVKKHTDESYFSIFAYIIRSTQNLLEFFKIVLFFLLLQFGESSSVYIPWISQFSSVGVESCLSSPCQFSPCRGVLSRCIIDTTSSQETGAIAERSCLCRLGKSGDSCQEGKIRIRYTWDGQSSPQRLHILESLKFYLVHYHNNFVWRGHANEHLHYNMQNVSAYDFM